MIMNKLGKYICIEGTEGVGKTTQIKNLCNYLKKNNYSFVNTRDIGSPHLDITVTLRKIMLDNQYSSQLSDMSRELISNGMRSIHLEKLVIPKLSEVDYVIQDRGFLSAISYGEACGNDPAFLKQLTDNIVNSSKIGRSSADLYDTLIILKGDSKKALARAKASKQEFESGDAMESLGDLFMNKVNQNFQLYKTGFNNVHEIDIEGKSINEVFAQILVILKI